VDCDAEEASEERRLRLRLGTASGVAIVEATPGEFEFPLVSNRVWIVRAGKLLRVAAECRLLVTLVLYALDARWKDSRVTVPRGLVASVPSKEPTPTVDVLVGGAANCKGARPLVGVDVFIVNSFVSLLYSAIHATNKQATTPIIRDEILLQSNERNPASIVEQS